MMNVPSPPVMIAPLDRDEEAQWGRFLETADHATVFHDLRFLAYHPPGRFRFHHLVARRAGEIVALLPGGFASDDERPMFVSPLGGSVGGPALKPDLAAKDILELVASFQNHARVQGWSGIEMTLPPAIYHERASDILGFSLFFRGFRLTNRWLCPMIPLIPGRRDQYRGLFRGTYANRVRANLRRGFSIVDGGVEQLENFLAVFRDTYERHGVSATHAPEEIADLLRRLPERVRLHIALFHGEPVAGLLVFLINPRVAYTFYICMSAAYPRESGNVSAVASLIDWLSERHYRWLDLGPTARASSFNAGVTFFKEGLGAIGQCRDQWRWIATDEVSAVAN